MMPDGQRFCDHVVVVTGATGGLGRACAVRLGREGATVAVIGRNPQRCNAISDAIIDAGGSALAMPGDLCRDGTIEAAIDLLVHRYGRIDAAVNAAGVSPKPSLLADVSTSAWDETLALDLTAVFQCMRAEINGMLTAGRGSIVNISSYAATTVQISGISPYAAAKWGVHGLTKAAARDYARQGIRINAVAPGHVRTPMIDRNLRSGGEARLQKRIPLGRVAEPDEIAGIVSFMLSDEASFITGQTLVADGGLSV